MPKETILIVEDDPDITELLHYRLDREGYSIIAADDGEKGLAQAIEHRPDAILLDLMLPGMDGLEICKELKKIEATSEIAILMVTAKGEEADIVTGLELGADDYITKPFSPREVIARLRAVLRRRKAAKAPPKKRIEIGDVALDQERYEVRVSGEIVVFTRAEFRLLWTLVSSPGRVYTRDDLVDRITGGDGVIVDRNVDVHVSAIRKKLGGDVDLIGTVRGVGYKCND
ncbi:MAG: two-component system alkaline phosphatase synthesis response regulator PhoP [Planctomycetota bacterium]|jgi:two-component system alkaline phosphatase synthesis response regulator PhoP